MRLISLLAILSLLTACGNAKPPAAPPAPPAATPDATLGVTKSSEPPVAAASTVQLTCPAQFSAATKLPSGSRVIGRFNGTLLLLQAQLSTGAPGAIADGWGLGALSHNEENESSKLPDGSLRTGYALKPLWSRLPGEVEQYMLACSYGPNWEAMISRSNAALVLIPLPAASTAHCEIIDAPPKGDQAQPPRSASCTIELGPSEAPPQVRAFLDELYAGYQSERGPDPLGENAPRLFSAKLLALIREDQKRAKEDDEVGVLDGDPFCNCQDWQALTVQKISTVGINENEATAKVTFTNAGKPVTVGMNLVRETGQWHVDDFDSPPPRGLAWSLSEGLQEQRKQAP